MEQVLSAATVYGYRGVEFRCDANQQHGVEAWSSAPNRAEWRDRMEGAGIQACCLSTSLQFVNDETIGGVDVRAELAADIGAPGIRVLCGPMPVGADLPFVIEQVSQRLREAAYRCEEHGVELWLETHDTCSTVADAAAAVAMAEHPAVNILYDNLHPYRMGERVAESFGHLGKYLRYVHLHDGINSPDQVIVRPVGQGDMPINDVFRHLLESGYDGYVGGEWFHDQYGPSPDESLEAYANDMADLAARHGTHFECH